MNNNELYVVTGASGRTGSTVARTLLKAGKRVRVIVRDKAKGNIWAKQGAEVAIATLTNTTALTKALSGSQAAYIISPQQYASNELFTQAETIANTIAEAVTKAQVSKVVALSSIGAEQVSGTGWIAMNTVLEKYLKQTERPTAFLRAAYFMQNWEAMIKAAATQQQLFSFLSPLDRTLPMIATDDVGRIAAEVLCEDWHESRIIELEGPMLYSPNDVASSLTKTLGKHVNIEAIPKPNWAEALANSGMSETAIDGFIEMTQALNSGHIAFVNNANIEHRQGSISLDTAITEMVASS